MRIDRLAAALRMVWRRPVRSALAAAGLALALSSALIAVAIAERSKEVALAEISSIGADILTISAEPSRNRGGRARSGDVVTTLTLADARDIARQVPGVRGIAAEYRAETLVKVGDLARQARVSGVEPSYGTIREAPLRSGRFFDGSDDVESRRVAVLGGRIALDLFPGRDPVGESFRIKGVPFAVVGVLTERGSGLDPFNEDEVVFIPLRVARRRVFQVDYVQRFFVRVGGGTTLPDASDAIVAMLQTRHRTPGGGRPDFRVQDQTRLVTVRETAVRRLGAFQIEVSAALLLSGSLGALALQLLSVRERRAEIGTRRALGATRPMIFAQFLTEGATVCLAGGVAGLALACVAALVSGLTLSPVLAAAAFVACAGAGIVASAAPARTAAALPPAVALRGQ